MEAFLDNGYFLYVSEKVALLKQAEESRQRMTSGERRRELFSLFLCKCECLPSRSFQEKISCLASWREHRLPIALCASEVSF